MTPQVTKRPHYRHNLEKLAEVALAYYPPIEEHLALIREINKSYKDKDYEYPDINDKGIMVPMPLNPFAEFVRQCRFELAQTNARERPPIQRAEPPPQAPLVND